MHFTVGVVTKNGDVAEVEKLLEPFDENIEVEPYIYMKKGEIIEDVKQRQLNLKKDMAEYAIDPEGFKEKYNIYWLVKNEDGIEKISEYNQKLLDCVTDEDFYNFYRSGDDDSRFNEDGDEMTTYNPKSKWDWWTIGGRWDGYLGTTDEEDNSCLIKNIPFNGTEEQRKHFARFWEVVVDGDELKEGEKESDFFTFYKKEYYIDRYHSKEEFATRSAKKFFYAVVTPEGEWVAPGEMGWFASSETNEEQKEYEKWFEDYMANHQDYYITLVDCHI